MNCLVSHRIASSIICSTLSCFVCIPFCHFFLFMFVYSVCLCLDSGSCSGSGSGSRCTNYRRLSHSRVPLRLNAFFQILFKYFYFFCFPLQVIHCSKLKIGLEVCGVPTAIVIATAYKEDGFLLNGAVGMSRASISLLISTEIIGLVGLTF